MERALFLDRDGVINVDHGYIGTVGRFHVIPGVFAALTRAEWLGYRLIVVTNQSGIARGYFSADDYGRVERHMVDVFAAHGISFTGIYHCPHHVDGVDGQFAVECSCRKPAPGLLIRACADHAIDPARSIMVGDKPSDLEAGGAAGVDNGFLIDSTAPETGKRFKSLSSLIASPIFEKIARQNR
ncbi:HAD family hydrolase [Sphingomonas sp. UYEF23]|uniref:D-glycero-alpha-D-manno-heptose-1,7-bisphosphate 7-phosphatase n=1 Tax=Sphingomonas sp. UYEF23 TaxID=1756408 RepID=UPI0033928DD9